VNKELAGTIARQFIISIDSIKFPSVFIYQVEVKNSIF
ncbi:uncharacterized protein METZ01_LOCUS138425, partial [marine metagenome]